MLPAAPDSSWLNLFWLPGPWSSTTCQSVPRGCLETCTRKVKCGLRRWEWGVWLSTQMGHKQGCNPGMALLDHRQTVRPTGPTGCLARLALLNPNPPNHWHGCSFPDVIGLRCWDLHDLRRNTATKQRRSCRKILVSPLVLPPASCHWPSLPHNGPTTTMTPARPAEEGSCQGKFGH